MRTSILAAWLVIFAVTAVDVGCVFCYGKYMDSWETNPIALSMLQLGIGTIGLVAFRIATVVIGCVLVNMTRIRIRLIATILILIPHIYLGIVYLMLANDGVAFLANPGRHI